MWRGLPNASPETVRCRRCDQSDLGSDGSGQIFDLTGGKNAKPEWSAKRRADEARRVRETVDDRRCDSSQAGVISPDEVRGVLREDENSGYSALSEEQEGEENPFDDFGGSGFADGGSENAQSPFKSLDEWKESDHPRDDEGKFGNSGNNIEKSSKRDKIRNKPRKEIQLPHDEYARVIHELNTNLTKEERNKKQIIRYIGDNVYIVQNNGFNQYKIIGKYGINK